VEGVVDLVSMKALYFDGDNGENVRTEEIPAKLLEEAKQKEKSSLMPPHSFLMT
jgi:elongation factor G